MTKKELLALIEALQTKVDALEARIAICEHAQIYSVPSPQVMPTPWDQWRCTTVDTAGNPTT